jgi:hypothetical protein
VFFQTLEPYLVDDTPDHRHRGRIARATLEPMWLWISNTLMPEDTRTYSEQVEQGLLAGDTDRVEHLARVYSRIARVRRIQQMLEASRTSGSAGRLTVQLGTPWALEDVQAVRGILDARDGLAMLGSRLPGHINVLQGPLLERVKSQIDTPLGARSDLFPLFACVVMGRLAAPWQLIRLQSRKSGATTPPALPKRPMRLRSIWCSTKSNGARASW